MNQESDTQRSEGTAVLLLEYIYGSLFRPVPTMQRLAHDQPLGLAVLVQVSLAILSMGLTVVGSTFLGGLASPALLVAGSLLAVISSLMIWVTVTGVLQMLAEVLGGKGTGLLAVTGFAQLPFVFSPVAAVLGRAAGAGLDVALSLVLSLWVAMLYILAVRETHGLSTARALGTFALGATALFALLFALIFVVIALWQSLADTFSM